MRKGFFGETERNELGNKKTCNVRLGGGKKGKNGDLKGGGVVGRGNKKSFKRKNSDGGKEKK